MNGDHPVVTGGPALSRGDSGSASTHRPALPREPLVAPAPRARPPKARLSEAASAGHARFIAKKRAVIAFLRAHEVFIPAWTTLAKMAKEAGVVGRMTDPRNVELSLQMTWRKRAFYESAKADTHQWLSQYQAIAAAPSESEKTPVSNRGPGE